MTTTEKQSQSTEIKSLLLQLGQLQTMKPRRRKVSASGNRCIARIWKSQPTGEYPQGRPGYGSRCVRQACVGDFCKQHGALSKKNNPCPDKKCVGYGKIHLYVWEHCGRYDEPCPKFFNANVWNTCTSACINDSSFETFKEQLGKLMPDEVAYCKQHYQQHKDNQEVFFRQMGGQKEIEEIRDLLVKHQPDELDYLGELVEEYKGRLSELKQNIINQSN